MQAMQQNNGHVVAKVISPEKRNQIAREFKSTHFQLSANEGASFKSSTQAQFRPHQVDGNPNSSKQTDIVMRKSNFNLGENRIIDISTTNKQSYQQPPDTYKAVTIDPATKNDLRKSHWTLGSFGQTKLSSTGIAFQKRSAPLSPTNQETFNKINLMRGHHFNFGNTPVQYETTNKSRYVDYSKRYKEVAPSGQTEAKNNLTKHHFNMGNQSSPMMTTTQIEFGQKNSSPQRATYSKLEFQKTSIQLGGEGSVPKNSTTQMHYTQHNHVPEKMDDNMKKNLRQAHFHLGQHPNQFESANTAYGGFNHNRGKSVENDAIKKKLQQSQIEVGDKTLGHVYFNTTYGAFNQPKKVDGGSPTAQNNVRSYQSNFALGGNNTLYATTSSAAVYQPQNQQKASPDRSFEKHLRANHFDIAHTNQVNPLHYQSTTKGTYYPANDISQYRGTINQARKDDLRKNHFDYGMPGQPAIVKSTNQATFQGQPSRDQSPSYHNALNLKHNSFKMSTQGVPPNHFTASSSLAFKWVQPEFSHDA